MRQPPTSAWRFPRELSCPRPSLGLASGAQAGRTREHHAPKTRRRVPRHRLARPRRLRLGRAGRGLSRGGHRPARRVAGLRPDRADDGLRDRPHLRLPPQPGGDAGPRGRRPLQQRGGAGLHRGAGAGRAVRRRDPLRRRLRTGRVQPLQGLRRQRLRRAQPGQILVHRGLRRRTRDDVLLPHDHPRRHRQARPGLHGAHRHRPGADADPPDQHPRDQHVGEPGALDEPGDLRRRRLPRAALDVLGRADRRRGAGRHRPPLARP